MISANLPENESQRLQLLDELEILDTIEEQAYDDLTRLAALICNTPISLVSLVDHKRQWFKSHYGLEARETPRDLAFCAHAILDDDILIVENASHDERFHDNPLVTSDPHVKFYAGVPLVMSDNTKPGTLCVISNEPQTMTEEQKQALMAIARQVVSQLELRLKILELERLDNAKDEFISMVSHELRTPLTSINGSLSLLMNNVKGRLNNQQRKIVEIGYRNANRLLGIVNDILDIAKMDAGKLNINKAIIDVKGLLEQAVSLNMPYCNDCGCQVELSQNDLAEHAKIEGDEQRLLQVVSNLISNAAKYTYNGDTIELSYDCHDGKAFIYVTDHGPGIPEDKKSLLFRKFQQINLSKNQKLPGTGLGLNLCKQIIDLHQGEIGFETVPGKHTTFFICLPIIGESTG